MFSVLTSVLKRIAKKLWGNLSGRELARFTLLGINLMLILGTYWLLRVAKNGVFKHLVGNFKAYQPKAKIVSLLIIPIVVTIYGKLSDRLSKTKLFAVTVWFFAAYYALLAYLIQHKELLSAEKLGSIVSWVPGNILGWITYTSLEMGSIMVIAFWAFTAATTSSESAKRGYPFVIFITQIGTILGSYFTGVMVEKIGFHGIFLTGAGVLTLPPFLMYITHKFFPGDREESGEDAAKPVVKKKSGILEGLKLLLTRPYLAGVFVVVTIYEIVGTLYEYEAVSIVEKVRGSGAGVSQFMSTMGVATNFLTLLFSLIGTSYLVRRFGVRFCLMLFPTLVAIVSAVLLVLGKMSLPGTVMMWILGAAVVTVKGLNYALNNPTKELLYIPTSKDVKFKAKGWIDSFGTRIMKGSGSLINDGVLKRIPVEVGIVVAPALAIAIALGWVVVAAKTGSKYESLQEKGEIVE